MLGIAYPVVVVALLLLVKIYLLLKYQSGGVESLCRILLFHRPSTESLEGNHCNAVLCSMELPLVPHNKMWAIIAMLQLHGHGHEHNVSFSIIL